MASRGSAFDPRTRQVRLGVKTWLSTFDSDTVYLSHGEKDLAVLINDLKETNWNTVIHSENVNVMYDTFSEKLANSYNKNCPIVNEKVKNTNRQAVDDKVINKCM